MADTIARAARAANSAKTARARAPHTPAGSGSEVLCLDIGSTFTKAVLVDTGSGAVLSNVAEPNRLPPDGDALDAVVSLRAQLAAGVGIDPQSLSGDSLLVCSSAGGGLRLAVVGYEALISAEAGHRVALSAGGTVVHVHAGALDGHGITALRQARPDVVLLVGGTDGGDAQVLLHNAERLGAARLAVPVVVAGNALAAPEALASLQRRGRRAVLTENVLPRIGEIAPQGARAAIREMFLSHVIGGKGLSRKKIDGLSFADVVRMATPDAMLSGVEVLAEVAGDCLVIDIGGATTDVYSVITPQGEDATLRKEAVAPLWQARTVEGDLGMRWSAMGVLDSARAEHLLTEAVAGQSTPLQGYAALVAAQPSHLPDSPLQQAHDTELAALAARIAVRRHARPAHRGGTGAEPRPLSDVRLLLGSGGVLRHGDAARREAVLAPILEDHAGGWRVPRQGRWQVDQHYVLFAVGLLAHAGSQQSAPHRLAADLVAGSSS